MIRKRVQVHTICVLAISALVFAGAATGLAQQLSQLPQVVITPPAGLSPKALQVVYYMVGPFGGYGGYNLPQENREDYLINASVNGKAATGIKIVVYARGCDFATFDVPLKSDETVHKAYVCPNLPTVRMNGRIVGYQSLPKLTKPEIIVYYGALWTYGFFNVKDGMEPQFLIATANPSSDGSFTLDLPNILASSLHLDDHEVGSFILQLRSSNLTADLVPQLHKTIMRNLDVSADYPEIQFDPKVR